MIHNKRVYALIGARGGSKGIPKKNIKELAGKPLIAYSIEDAKKSKYIDKVIVSTDCEEIAEIAKKYGAELPFMRSAEAASDMATDMDTLNDFLKQLKEKGIEEPDYIVFLRPTSPLRIETDIDKALEAMEKDEKATGARLIKEVPYPPFWMKKVENNRLVSFMKTEYEYARRQDLPKVYRGTGEIEILKPSTIKKGSMYGEEILPIGTSNPIIFEIDTEDDWNYAEVIMNKRKSDTDE